MFALKQWLGLKFPLPVLAIALAAGWSCAIESGLEYCKLVDGITEAPFFGQDLKPFDVAPL